MLKHFQLRKNMKETKDELDKTKDKLDKTKDKLGETKDKLDKTKDKLDKTKDKLDKTKDKLDKTKDDTSKKSYDPNGFDINGKHKDTGTFLNKENDIRKDISKNINWLKDKDEFLKLYDEINKNGEFSETINK